MKNAPAPERPTTAPAVPANSDGMVTLHYLEQSPILVRGPVSGRYYEFSAARPDRQIDPRDAPQLLRTSFFRRAP